LNNVMINFCIWDKVVTSIGIGRRSTENETRTCDVFPRLIILQLLPSFHPFIPFNQYNAFSNNFYINNLL